MQICTKFPCELQQRLSNFLRPPPAHPSARPSAQASRGPRGRRTPQDVVETVWLFWCLCKRWKDERRQRSHDRAVSMGQSIDSLLRSQLLSAQCIFEHVRDAILSAPNDKMTAFMSKHAWDETALRFRISLNHLQQLLPQLKFSEEDVGESNSARGTNLRHFIVQLFQCECFLDLGVQRGVVPMPSKLVKTTSAIDLYGAFKLSASFLFLC